MTRSEAAEILRQLLNRAYDERDAGSLSALTLALSIMSDWSSRLARLMALESSIRARADFDLRHKGITEAQEAAIIAQGVTRAREIMEGMP